MLKLLGAKQVGSRDLEDVRAVLDADPVAACMIAARVEECGVDPRMIHGELWSRGGPLSSCALPGRIWFRFGASWMTFGHSLTVPAGFRVCARR
ncbi:hypothetical protein GCM10020255_073530 [Rhodococcus baikonurensis]